MVQAMINVSEKANQILNIVKARFNFKDKSQAIEFITMEYGAEILEPELRPEYIKKAISIQKQQPIHVGSVENLRKRYEN